MSGNGGNRIVVAGMSGRKELRPPHSRLMMFGMSILECRTMLNARTILCEAGVVLASRWDRSRRQLDGAPLPVRGGGNHRGRSHHKAHEHCHEGGEVLQEVCDQFRGFE